MKDIQSVPREWNPTMEGASTTSLRDSKEPTNATPSRLGRSFRSCITERTQEQKDDESPSNRGCSDKPVHSPAPQTSSLRADSR